jgi:hypothetical protein
MFYKGFKMSILSTKQEYDSSLPYSFDQTDKTSFALIRHLYFSEKNEIGRIESSTKVVSVSIPAHEAILLGHIAKRFGMSLSAFLAQFLDGMARDCFQALDKDDRLTIGKQADLDYVEFERDRGFSGFIQDHWERAAETYNRHEERELAQFIEEQHQKEITQALLANATPVNNQEGN